MYIYSLILILLQLLLVKFLAHVHSFLRDREAQVGDTVAKLVHELAVFGHVLILVDEKIANIGAHWRFM